MAVGRYGGSVAPEHPRGADRLFHPGTAQDPPIHHPTRQLLQHRHTALPPYRHTAYLTGVASVSLCRDIRDRK